MTIKAELLDRYARREPKRFWQIDCWTFGDDFQPPDADGHSMTACRVSELMFGSAARILIPLDGTCEPAVAAALLRKAAAWLERDPMLLTGEDTEAGQDRNGRPWLQEAA